MSDEEDLDTFVQTYLEREDVPQYASQLYGRFFVKIGNSPDSDRYFCTGFYEKVLRDAYTQGFNPEEGSISLTPKESLFDRIRAAERRFVRVQRIVHRLQRGHSL